MYEIEIKRDGVVVATIQWSPTGGHNTKIKGAWGETSSSHNNVPDVIRQTLLMVAGL